MGLQLYDYQLDAIRKMKNGCILNGGVGSGKSFTALGYFFNLYGGNLDNIANNPMDDTIVPDLYIITTARKRDTHEWDKELSVFLLSTHKESNLYANKVIIDSWNNIKKYQDIENAFFIFDEDRVTGYGAWSKAFLKITKSNRWIILSATPGDQWVDYIPVFIANGFYKNKTDFTRNHVVYSYHTDFPKIDRYVNTGRLIRLRNSILVDMDFDRQTKAHHETIITEYDILKYKELIRKRWNPWDDKPIENASEFCYSLRRLVNEDPSRQVKLLEILEQKSRVIIFYNFDFELDILRNLGYMEGTEVAEWNGHKHQPIPTSDRWVYLVHYNSAEGWNCTQTDTIIFYSQNYSYKMMVQAAGRIDRLNTSYLDLYYYHFRSNSGIDLAINRALKNKKKFNESRFMKGL